MGPVDFSTVIPMSDRDGDDPRAPHWLPFDEINDLPNAWTFEVTEWDDDPEVDGIEDRGEAVVERGEHRFVVTTYLQCRDRTHDRYYGIAYETINQDGEPEPLAYHISTSQSIARNNLGTGRDVVGREDTTPHILVREHDDSPRETFEYPCEYMAEKAADLQLELRVGNDDREYMMTVHSKEEWEDRLELEQSLEEDESV